MDEITGHVSPVPQLNESSDESSESPKQEKTSVLPLTQKLGFSVGHFLNDLCSAVWFTYLLIYLQYVRQLSGQLAGIALLVGQIADGMATPFVGLESDRNSRWSFCLAYGKRKSWHAFGTLCVIFSFPMIFIQCIGCNQLTHTLSQLIYYSGFIVIFQFGWASVQISQLSLIPTLSPCTHERLQLNSWVYAWTVSANIVVYSVTWYLLGREDANEPVPTPDAQYKKVSPSDADKFRNLVLIIVALGSLFSFVFHFVVKENREPNDENEDERPIMRKRTISVTSVDYTLTCNHLKWYHWFKVSQFYKIGLLYSGTRLCINLTQAYIPFYLQETLNLHRVSEQQHIDSLDQE
jgi:Na+/melibiose symporter-like transporter